MQARYHASGRNRIASYYFIHFIFLATAACFLSPLNGQQILSVVSAANNAPVISPKFCSHDYLRDELSAGVSLRADKREWEPCRPPSAALSVSIGGKPAQLLYASPSQTQLLVRPIEYSAGLGDSKCNCAELSKRPRPAQCPSHRHHPAYLPFLACGLHAAPFSTA